METHESISFALLTRSCLNVAAAQRSISNSATDTRASRALAQKESTRNMRKHEPVRIILANGVG